LSSHTARPRPHGVCGPATGSTYLPVLSPRIGRARTWTYREGLAINKPSIFALPRLGGPGVLLTTDAALSLEILDELLAEGVDDPEAREAFLGLRDALRGL
jgi:hypothetical protein